MTSSDRVGSGLARTDADGFLDRRHENLSVSDAAGLCRLADRLDGALHQIVVQDDLELHLGQKVDDVFCPAVQLGVALLAPEALRLDDGDPLEADLLEGFFDFIELERLDDGFDLLHRITVSVRDLPLLASGQGCLPWPLRFKLSGIAPLRGTSCPKFVHVRISSAKDLRAPILRPQMPPELVLRPQEMKQADALTIASGIPGIELMR